MLPHIFIEIYKIPFKVRNLLLHTTAFHIQSLRFLQTLTIVHNAKQEYSLGRISVNASIKKMVYTSVYTINKCGNYILPHFMQFVNIFVNFYNHQSLRQSPRRFWLGRLRP